MPTASINLPLYRVLRSLNVSEDAAAGAAEVPAAAPIDLSQLATRDELRAEIAGVRTEVAGLRAELRTEIANLPTRDDLARFATRDELRAEIAQAGQRQIVWLIGIIFTAAGLAFPLLRVLPAR